VPRNDARRGAVPPRTAGATRLQVNTCAPGEDRAGGAGGRCPDPAEAHVSQSSAGNPSQGSCLAWRVGTPRCAPPGGGTWVMTASIGRTDGVGRVGPPCRCIARHGAAFRLSRPTRSDAVPSLRWRCQRKDLACDRQGGARSPGPAPIASTSSNQCDRFKLTLNIFPPSFVAVKGRRALAQHIIASLLCCVNPGECDLRRG
jgi:hypothetical protein